MKRIGSPNVLPFDRGDVSATHRASNVLPVDDAALFEEIVEGYRNRRMGALRHHHKSVGRDVTVVRDMVGFTGVSPWTWTGDDFDRWCHELARTRRLSVATHRHYQGAVRGFLEYVVQNVGFCNRIMTAYGIRPVQIVGPENSIPHLLDREIKKERRALTHDEIISLFDGFERSIREAATFKGKDLRPLQRDKVLFYTIYILGLRVSEAIALNVDSFEPTPSLPEFGAFGIARIWGKGSRGSGPKFRCVMIDHIDLPPLLDWYVKSIRPKFLCNSDPNERAFFLSERGARIALSTLEARFQKAMSNAGLNGHDLTPHSLRHSMVTHGSMRLSGEAIRRKAGHAHASTTQGYMHVPDEYVAAEIGRSITDQIAGCRRDGDE